MITEVEVCIHNAKGRDVIAAMHVETSKEGICVFRLFNADECGIEMYDPSNEGVEFPVDLDFESASKLHLNLFMTCGVL